MCETLSYLPSAAESEEETSVVYDNMVLMANYLVDLSEDLTGGRRSLQEQ